MAAQRSAATAPLPSRFREAPPRSTRRSPASPTPAISNFNGSDTLTVTTGDGTAQDIDTVAITVNPVNDAPVNTVPGAQSVNEDTALPIAGVSVADVDSPALTTTLTVTSGTLNVTTGGGATIGGNGSAAVTLSGSAAQINAALAGLSYTGNLNFNGSDTLTVVTTERRRRDGHRHGRHHRQPGERCAGQHGAGTRRPSMRTRRCPSPACRSRTRTARR